MDQIWGSGIKIMDQTWIKYGALEQKNGSNMDQIWSSRNRKMDQIWIKDRALGIKNG